jgi:hypothetical protein
LKVRYQIQYGDRSCTLKRHVADVPADEVAAMLDLLAEVAEAERADDGDIDAD